MSPVTYMKPRLKLDAMIIFSLNFICSFQMKIQGSMAK